MNAVFAGDQEEQAPKPPSLMTRSWLAIQEGDWTLLAQWLMALFNLLVLLGLIFLDEKQLAAINSFLILTGTLIIRAQTFTRRAHNQDLWLTAERSFNEGQASMVEWETSE